MLNTNININKPVIVLGGSGGSSEPEVVTLYHFVVIGQSQAGGYASSPALSTSGDDNVKTLTDGPLDVNTGGSLIPLVEGDTFSDTLIGGGGPSATEDVETIATSFAQQLKIFRNSNPNDVYAVTVHATGGTTIQQLSDGGGSGQYEEAIASVARMKAIADTNNWNFVTHLIFFHGGTGDNVGTTYQAKLEALYQDFLTDTAAYTDQDDVYMFTWQQREIGTPDYSIQQYEASLANPNIIVCGRRDQVALQGDNIHYTNHGERHTAMYFARAVYYQLFSTGFSPLELDIDNAIYDDGANTITIPVLNAIGALDGTSNYGIQVYSETLSSTVASTVAIDGTDIVITITGTAMGEHDLLIQTGVTARGELHDSAGSIDVPSFLNGSSNPYNLDKYIVRAEYELQVRFPIPGILISFGGASTAPGVTEYDSQPVYELWDNTKSTSTESYPLHGNISFDALNTASNYWGFTGTEVKGGENSLAGTNFYPNNILKDFWFIENKSVDNRINGLDPNKTYKLTFTGLRTGTATSRVTIVTVPIGGSSVTKTSNRSGTSGVFTTEAECAVFNGISPNVSGQITFTVDQDSTQFGYLNTLRIEEE